MLHLGIDVKDFVTRSVNFKDKKVPRFFYFINLF